LPGAANRGDPHQPGIFCANSPALIANNIVAFCASGISGDDAITFRNNCLFNSGYNYQGIPDETGAGGNISADPQFVPNTNYPDIHLLPTSPCVDAGDTALVPPGSLNIDGGPRIVGAAVDIGADEYNPTAEIQTVSAQHKRSKANHTVGE
jgi:hypothetical protein